MPRSSADVPDEILAQLTFDGSPGTEYSYDTTGLEAGDSLRFALQVDATSLDTGRYGYSITLTAIYGEDSVEQTYSGTRAIVNRGGANSPFGRGWQLAGVDELVEGSGGVLWVQAAGEALWFPDDACGGYLDAEGDFSWSSLVENQGGTFTLTDKHGIETHFSSSGLIASREDRSGNTIEYTFTGV